MDQLRVAAEAVTEGRLDVEVPLQRADEFGSLIAEFNRMVTGLREKEQLRQALNNKRAWTLTCYGTFILVCILLYVVYLVVAYIGAHH